jgi:hypothetical protein
LTYSERLLYDFLMAIEKAIETVKKRYGLLTVYIDAASGRMMHVIKAEAELSAIPEVKWPKGGISLSASEVVELARGHVTIRDLVERKNPELFHKNPAASELGRKGGRVVSKRGPEYFRQLQAKRQHKRGGRPPKKPK